jgi:hypothetical protein
MMEKLLQMTPQDDAFQLSGPLAAKLEMGVA